MKRGIGFLLAMVLMGSVLLPVCAEEASQEEIAPAVQTGEEDHTPTECPHAFGAWSDTGNGHSRVCSLCGATESGSHGWDAGTVTTAPACTEAGTKVFSCGVCGTEKTETIPPAGHTYGAWQQADASGHKRTCSVCGTEETRQHTWDGGRITGKPTCQAQGEKVYTCGDCGAEKKEVLPVSDHAFSEWVLDEETHSRTCTVCGKTESGLHSWDGGSVKIPATCLEEGAFVYVCSGCGGVLIEMIPKLTTHTYDSPCDPDCNVCGAERETEHKFSAAWSRNSVEHWHSCILCGEKKDVALHYPGPAATEEKAQLCLVCGLTMTARLNHTHRFSDQLSRDDTGHWHACEGCEERKDFEEHSYDGTCDSNCNVCGFVTGDAHDYGTEWLSDERGHWHACTLCGQESDCEPHSPGPEAEGKARFCEVCGYVVAPAGEHEHSFGTRWEQGDTMHWKQCECGERAEEAQHSWDHGVKKSDQTVIFTCGVCGAERTEAAVEKDFPWSLVLTGLLAVCAGCAGLLIWYLRRNRSGKFVR